MHLGHNRRQKIVTWVTRPLPVPSGILIHPLCPPSAPRRQFPADDIFNLHVRFDVREKEVLLSLSSIVAGKIHSGA